MLSDKNVHYIRESEWNNNNKNTKFTNLNTRNVVLMNKIKNFYNNKNNLDILISIIHGESHLSLRVIDFFVTNYSREKEIIYEITSLNKIIKFMVYYSYKSQLKAYSKKQFDPFCRRERILFFIKEYDGIRNDPIRTTVGQLNFFRWAIQNKILDYIYNNYDKIENEMNKFSKNGKSKKKRNIKINKKENKINNKKENKINNKKEKSNVIKQNNKSNSVLLSSDTSNNLTLSATKKVSKHNITITVKFN